MTIFVTHMIYYKKRKDNKMIFLFLFCPWFWAIAFFPVILRVIAKFYNWVYDT